MVLMTAATEIVIEKSGICVKDKEGMEMRLGKVSSDESCFDIIETLL